MEVAVLSDRQSGIQHAVGAAFSLARHRACTTQKEAAAMSGLTHVSISRLEVGIANPTLLTMERLADALGYDMDIRLVQRRPDTTGTAPMTMAGKLAEENARLRREVSRLREENERSKSRNTRLERKILEAAAALEL